MKPVLTPDEIEALIHGVFPQVRGQFTIEAMAEDGLTVRLHTNDSHLRPGGTISGPAMFTLADCAFYFATLAMIGPEALTVTTNCNIDFLRKPPPGDLLGAARILKLGKTLSVGDVLIRSDVSGEVVARASLTYAIPPKRG